MPKIEYQGRTFPLLENETVLDGLIRNGIDAPHACKAGACGSCLMRKVSGTIPERSQTGLSATWKAQDYFLPCVCRPESDIAIAAPASDVQVGAAISSLSLLSANVMRVRLHADSPITFRAGQYVTILQESGLARSYSIACLPEDGEIELHVRKIVAGRMSGWFHDQARVGSRVTVRGPAGNCFYVPDNPDQPILLAGAGTGLAPLYGILRDALRNGHRGPLHLFHGALHAQGLYLVEELRKLAAGNQHVEYNPTVLNGSESDGVSVGQLDEVILRRFPKLNGWRAYICGDPDLVNRLRKKLFLAGAASRDIFADAFLPSA